MCIYFSDADHIQGGVKQTKDTALTLCKKLRFLHFLFLLQHFRWKLSLTLSAKKGWQILISASPFSAQGEIQRESVL